MASSSGDNAENKRPSRRDSSMRLVRERSVKGGRRPGLERATSSGSESSRSDNMEYGKAASRTRQRKRSQPICERASESVAEAITNASLDVTLVRSLTLTLILTLR